MSRRRVFEWYKRFKEGREEIADNERSGRPSTSTTPEKVDKVLELNAWKETASLNLGATTDDPELLKRVITGDETWIYGFDSETTQQASEWRFKNEPRPKKARKAPSKVKVMLTVFFDYQGIVHHEFQQQGSTITADSYLGVLRRLREAIRTTGQLACFKGVHAAFRTGGKNAYSWLAESSAWMAPLSSGSWLLPRRRRFLDLWKQAFSILDLNHRVVPTPTLLNLSLVGACRFLATPSLGEKCASAICRVLGHDDLAFSGAIQRTSLCGWALLAPGIEPARLEDPAITISSAAKNAIYVFFVKCVVSLETQWCEEWSMDSSQLQNELKECEKGDNPEVEKIIATIYRRADLSRQTKVLQQLEIHPDLESKISRYLEKWEDIKSKTFNDLDTDQRKDINDKAINTIRRPPRLQGCIFVQGLDDDANSILTSTKSFRYRLSLEMRGRGLMKTSEEDF
ncbi:hypothetical protein LAZ67_X002751 [Cordylochernes scorpioides]|uniref:Uncharacterized protein n=1 Tax=Cordylochernes scorpioides TaxID=51811 RepID=A0ABY6LTL9_9ARAC|nr:hypothetical protein LAZ67_X002751 [Cordylochernes scorpioides]